MSARKLGFNAVVYGLGAMLSRTISLLLLPLFTRFLTTEDYGRAGMISILSVFLTAVFSLGIGGSLASCYYKEETEDGKRRTIITGVWLLVLSCALMLVLLLPFSGWIAKSLLRSEDWTGLICESLLTTAASVMVTPFIYSIQWEGQSRLFVGLSAVATLVMAVCNIVAVAWLRMGLHGWILSQLIGQLLGLVLYSFPFLRRGLPRPRRLTLRSLILLGLPMVPSFGCFFVIQQGNRYLLECFYGLSSLGIYNVAIGLATVSSMAVSAFQTSWGPYYMSYRSHVGEAETVFGKSATWFFYLAGMATVCFFGFAQPVVELMAGSAFHEAWRSVGMVALASFLAGASNLLMPAQYFSDKLGHLTLMQAVTAGVALNLNIWMLNWLGPEASGSALAASFAFLLVLHYWWNRRGFSMKLPVRYEWGRLMMVGVCIAISAVITLCFPARAVSVLGVSLNGIVAGLLRGTLMAGGFVAVLWISLSPESRKSLLQRLPFGRRRHEVHEAANQPVPP